MVPEPSAAGTNVGGIAGFAFTTCLSEISLGDVQFSRAPLRSLCPGSPNSIGEPGCSLGEPCAGTGTAGPDDGDAGSCCAAPGLAAVVQQRVRRLVQLLPLHPSCRRQVPLPVLHGSMSRRSLILQSLIVAFRVSAAPSKGVLALLFKKVDKSQGKCGNNALGENGRFRTFFGSVDGHTVPENETVFLIFPNLSYHFCISHAIITMYFCHLCFHFCSFSRVF